MTVLRFEITPPHGEKSISELSVGIGDPSKYCLQPKNGQKRRAMVSIGRLLTRACPAADVRMG